MNELVSARLPASRSTAPSLRNGVRAAFRLALDFALPRLCPSCRKLGDGSGLCALCWSKLSLIEPPYCVRLGIPFAYNPGSGLLSMEAIANPPAYDRARAAVHYDYVSRALVHSLKYGDRLDLAPMMGQWMARAGRELLADADTLIPVPLHWWRQWARRFNQSGALAGAISTLSGVPVAHGGLKRMRATPQQVGRSRAESADNVQGAFRVADEHRANITGRRRCAGLCAGCSAGAHSHIKDIQTRNNAVPPIEIYTTRYCSFCAAAKALLTRKGVSYSEIDLSRDWERRREMIQRANGRMTVPQIFIGTIHVGGSDELHALERAGKLDPLLAGDRAST